MHIRGVAQRIREGDRATRGVDVAGSARAKWVSHAASDAEIIGQLRNVAEGIGEGNWLTIRIVS